MKLEKKRKFSHLSPDRITPSRTTSERILANVPLQIAGLWTLFTGLAYRVLLRDSRFEAIACLAAVVGLLAAVILFVVADARSRAARRRLAGGICENCRYNIAECPERCSECGHPVPKGHRTRSQIMGDLKKL